MATLPAILLAVWTLVLTLAALHLVSLGFNVTTYVTNVATAFGIGIAIDYSIFMHLRFCEEMQRQRPDPSAELLGVVEKVVATSGRTVLFSGALLMSSLVGALQFNMYYLTTMALTMVFIALFAALGAVTVLPALYLLLGRNIFLLSVEPFVNVSAEFFLKNLFFSEWHNQIASFGHSAIGVEAEVCIIERLNAMFMANPDRRC